MTIDLEGTERVRIAIVAIVAVVAPLLGVAGLIFVGLASKRSVRQRRHAVRLEDRQFTGVHAAVDSVEQLKAALLQISTQLNETAALASRITQAWEQASNSFASLMTGTNNPYTAEVQAFLAAGATDAFELEGRSVPLDEMIRNLVATM